MAKKKKKEYEKIVLPPKEPIPPPPVEELDEKIEAAEKTLREMGLEKDVWLKKPLDVDQSYHLFFTKLDDPDGVIMLQQIAGESLRLLMAPPYLKKGGVVHLEELIEFAPLAQVEPEPEEEEKAVVADSDGESEES
jgi:hypothetical protein